MLRLVNGEKTRMKIIRVFPRKTRATPDDLNVRIGCPTILDYVEKIDSVLISVTFTWDIQEAERLEKSWKHLAPVKIGGPAYGDKGDEFFPGKFLKPGYTITSRGCPNHCWFCTAWKREGTIREYPIKDGWNVLDNNLFACSKEHQRKVFEMLLRQPQKASLSGGLEAARLTDWHIGWIQKLKPSLMWFAYDEPKDWEPLMEAAFLLQKGGIIRPSNHGVGCYVLCGYKGDEIIKADQRCRNVAKLGFFPQAMLYDRGNNLSLEDCQKWRKFAREWSNKVIVGSKLKYIKRVFNENQVTPS